MQHQLSVSPRLDGLAEALIRTPPPPWVGLDVMAGGEGLVLLPGNRLPDCRTVPMRDPGAVPTNDCKYPITPPPLPPSAGPPASHPRPGAPIVLPRSETFHTRSQPLPNLLLRFCICTLLLLMGDLKSSRDTMQQSTRNQASNFCPPIWSDLNLQPVSC